MLFALIAGLERGLRGAGSEASIVQSLTCLLGKLTCPLTLNSFVPFQLVAACEQSFVCRLQLLLESLNGAV